MAPGYYYNTLPTNYSTTNWGNQNNYANTNGWQSQYASTNFAMPNQYGMMPDTTLNFMQPLNFGSGSTSESNNTTSTSEAATTEQHEIKKAKISNDGINGKDDGKISGSKKFEHFVKGIGNFFTGMFCGKDGKFSLKRTLTTVGIAAGAIALTVATGGAAAPFLVAAGVAIGGAQVIKGGIRASKATTDAEAQAAWEDIGAGATSIGVSMLGAKSALKSGGVAPKGGMIKSTAQCFVESGKSTAKFVKSPIASLRTVPGNLKQVFNTNLKANKIADEISPIDAKIAKAQAKLRNARKSGKVEKIIKRQTELSELNIQKAKYQQSLTETITKAKLKTQENNIKTLTDELIAKNEVLTADATPEQLQALKQLELNLKRAQDQFNHDSNLFKYDKWQADLTQNKAKISELKQKLSSTTSKTRKTAVKKLITRAEFDLMKAKYSTAKGNAKLINKKYMSPATFLSGTISGHINREETPDGLIEVFVDTVTGQEIDPSTLTEEQKTNIKSATVEELDEIMKKAEAETNKTDEAKI